MGGKLLNRNLLTRALSGAVFVAVVVGAVLFSPWTFGALLVVIGAGCLHEFYKIAAKAGAEPQRDYGMALGVVLIATAFFVVRGYLLPATLLLFAPLGAVVFIVELYRKRDNPLINCAVTLTGVFYVAVPLALFGSLAACRQGVAAAGCPMGYTAWEVLWYFIIVWGNDTGAYLVGVAFGRHRLFERISPKKSWEGFFGGVAVATALAAWGGHLMGHNPLWWGGLGLVIALSGVLGDLVESMFKRAVDMKDSGEIFPGHGGWLDRFDALLISLPFAVIYLMLF